VPRHPGASGPHALTTSETRSCHEPRCPRGFWQKICQPAKSALGGNAKTVIANPRASYEFIGNIGSRLYVQTDDDAQRYRVIAIDLAGPGPTHWRTVIPESRDTLRRTTVVGHQLIAQHLEDAHNAVRRYAPDGKRPGEVNPPGLGASSGFAGRIDDAATCYKYADYATPTSIYRLDLTTGVTSLGRAPQVAGFKSSDCETKQVLYTSKDGRRVPMFVNAPKGTRLDGRNPTILYAYGGFNISLQREFSPGLAAWLELGGPRRCESTWRRRIWACLARSRHEDPQTEPVR
jgi:prolyl oligopeptidase